MTITYTRGAGVAFRSYVSMPLCCSASVTFFSLPKLQKKTPLKENQARESAHSQCKLERLCPSQWVFLFASMCLASQVWVVAFFFFNSLLGIKFIGSCKYHTWTKEPSRLNPQCEWKKGYKWKKRCNGGKASFSQHCNCVDGEVNQHKQLRGCWK